MSDWVDGWVGRLVGVRKDGWMGRWVPTRRRFGDPRNKDEAKLIINTGRCRNEVSWDADVQSFSIFFSPALQLFTWFDIVKS